MGKVITQTPEEHQLKVQRDYENSLCPNCGTEDMLSAIRGGGKYFCQHCGTKWIVTEEEESNEV